MKDWLIWEGPASLRQAAEKLVRPVILMGLRR